MIIEYTLAKKFLNLSNGCKLSHKRSFPQYAPWVYRQSGLHLPLVHIILMITEVTPKLADTFRVANCFIKDQLSPRRHLALSVCDGYSYQLVINSRFPMKTIRWYNFIGECFSGINLKCGYYSWISTKSDNYC